MKEARKIFKSCSDLLLSFDSLMAKKKWFAKAASDKGTEDRVAFDYSSRTIDAPNRWMPSLVYRFYINEKYPHLLTFVSIILDDVRDTDKVYTVDESLITSGYFNYGKGNHDRKYDGWYARWFLYTGEGIGSTIRSTKGWQKEWDETGLYSFKTWKCFALPLTTIRNTADLDRMVASRLLKMVPK